MDSYLWSLILCLVIHERGKTIETNLWLLIWGVCFCCSLWNLILGSWARLCRVCVCVPVEFIWGDWLGGRYDRSVSWIHIRVVNLGWTWKNIVDESIETKLQKHGPQHFQSTWQVWPDMWNSALRVPPAVTQVDGLPPVAYSRAGEV